MDEPSTPEGRRFEALRRHCGLSKADLARRAGISRQTLYDVIRRGTAPDDTAEKLARVLGVTSSELFSGPNSADVTDERLSPDRASVERPLPRVVRSHAVRVWLKEFELDLTRAGVPEERIAEAIDLVTAPSVFRYFVGGGAEREMEEERAVRAMETLARIVRMREREAGYNVAEPGT